MKVAASEMDLPTWEVAEGAETVKSQRSPKLRRSPRTNGMPVASPPRSLPLGELCDDPSRRSLVRQVAWISPRAFSRPHAECPQVGPDAKLLNHVPALTLAEPVGERCRLGLKRT